MGQYYKPVNLDNKQWLYSHDCKYSFKRDDGTKVTVGNGLKLMEHSWVGNDFVQSVMNLLIAGAAWYKSRIVWAGDYADANIFPPVDDSVNNVYSVVDDTTKIKPPKANKTKGVNWLLNHSKKEAVLIPAYKKDAWQPHPLPLLTCSGNGRGGGDYRNENEFLGSWAGDSISLEAEPPADFKVIEPNFIED